MLDGLIILCIIGSLLGLLYPCVVGVTLVLCVLLKRAFRPRLSEWSSLFAPGVTYYFLELFVSRRQDWNEVYAVTPLSVFSALLVVVACVLGRPRALLRGSAIGVPLAVVLWLFVPGGHWDRLF